MLGNNFLSPFRMNHDFQVGVHKLNKFCQIFDQSFSPADEPLTIFSLFLQKFGNSVSIYLFQNDHVFFVSDPVLIKSCNNFSESLSWSKIILSDAKE